MFGWPKFPQSVHLSGQISPMPPYVFGLTIAKSFQHYYDINNLTHDGRKEKEEEKETIALEVVTDGKNDKTKKNDKEYVHNKRTWDGTCVLFCVPPSFVLMDNKYILSCAHFLYGAH